MSELEDAFNRYYLSLSVAELKMSELSADIGRLPYNTVLYLDYISYRPGCTATEIAKAIGVTKATVSSTVARLEKKGLIVRDRSETDGRVRHLRLSDNMADVYKLCSGMTSEMAETISRNHSEDEIDLFCRMLNEASDSWEFSFGKGHSDREMGKVSLSDHRSGAHEGL